jgi:hypothetical protein
MFHAGIIAVARRLDHECPPYTKPDPLACDINLTTLLERLDPLACDANLCEEFIA